jgi:hypothetical protein
MKTIRIHGMTRISIVALSFVLATAPALLHAQKQPVGAGRIAGETALGFLGAPVGFAVGYTIGSGFRPHGSSNTGVTLGFAGALLGPALGVSVVGNGGPSQGKFGATVGGAALGYVATYLAVPVASKVNPMKLKIAALAVAFALPAVGATIGYNATRK